MAEQASDYRQLIAAAKVELSDGKPIEAVRAVNVDFVLGLLTPYLTASASAEEICTVILSTIRCGTFIKGNVKNLDVEQKRRFLFTGGIFSDELMDRIQELIETLPVQEKEALAIPLGAMLNSGSVSENAFRTLALLGPQARPVVNALVEQALRWTQNATWSRMSALVLQNIGADLVVPELVRILKKTPSNDLYQQTQILSLLADWGEPTLEYVIPCIGTHASLPAFKKIGPVAIPAILQVLKNVDVTAPTNWSDDDDVKRGMMSRSVAQILSEFGAASVDPVIEAIRSTAGKPRLAILEMFSFLKGAAVSVEAAPVLCRLFFEDEESYWFARNALRVIGAAAIPLVCDVLAGSDRSIHSRVREFLWSFSYADTPELLSCLSHSEPIVQAAVGVAVLKITGAPDAAAMNKLATLLQDDDISGALTALEALTQCAYEGLQLMPPLIETLKSAEPILRQRTARADEDTRERTRDALDQLMGFVSLAQFEKCSEIDTRRLLVYLGVRNVDMRMQALREIESLANREHITDATMNAVRAAAPLLKRQANRASAELGHRMSEAIEQLLKLSSFSAACASSAELQGREASTNAEPVSSLPSMPDYNIIKEALERQFPEGMVARRMGYQEQNERGEVEFLLREDRAAIQFSARQLAYPPTSHSPGQPRFFKEHIILSISAGQEFRGSGGPFGGSCGLYAYDGQRLTHLDGGDAEQHIGDVLRSESLDLDHVDPAELALFFCHT